MEETFTFFNTNFSWLVLLIQGNVPQALTAMFLAGMVGGTRNNATRRAIWTAVAYFPMLFVVVTLTNLSVLGEYETLIAIVVVAWSSAVIGKADYRVDPTKK